MSIMEVSWDVSTKLEKIGKEEVLSSIQEVLGDNNFDATVLLDFLAQKVSINDLGSLHSQSLNHLFLEGVGELMNVANMALSKGVREQELVVDLSIARGLDYYTGTVFETRLMQYPQVGSVCSGGRYENLVGVFTDKGNFPGVGMSIGLTRLLSQLFRYKVIVPHAQSYSKLFIIPLSSGKEVVDYVEQLATRLRAWDVPCEVSLTMAGKLSKQIEYAQKR